MSAARTPAEAPPASPSPTPPSAPRPVLRLPARRALLTGRASQPANRPRRASGQGEFRPPLPAAPSPDLEPVEAPASAARASRVVLGAGGCCVSTSQSPGPHPGEAGSAPAQILADLEEEPSSFIPGPRCRRPAASALSSLSVSPYPRFSYFSTSLPGYPKPRFSPLPGWHVSLWASAAG